jgi:hypothetical protein
MSPTTMTTLVLLLVLLNLTSAYTCINSTYSFSLSAISATFGNLAIPTTNEDVVAFALSATKQGQNFTAEALTGYHTQSGNY